MTNEEMKRLVALREKEQRDLGLPFADYLRLATLEKKMEIESSDWTVHRDGTMTHEDPYYCIEGHRLSENWLEHMRGKRWLKMATFVEAYIRACYAAGVKTVQITY